MCPSPRQLAVLFRSRLSSLFSVVLSSFSLVYPSSALSSVCVLHLSSSRHACISSIASPRYFLETCVTLLVSPMCLILILCVTVHSHRSILISFTSIHRFSCLSVALILLARLIGVYFVITQTHQTFVKMFVGNNVQFMSTACFNNICEESTMTDSCVKFQVAEYRKGSTKVLNFLMGQAMKATKGRVDPKATTKTLKSMLE